MEPQALTDWAWREMRVEDLPHIARIAAVVHPRYPEKDEIFVERLRLYPGGSRVLTRENGRVVGYVVSHPWRFGAVPALDSALGALPPDADCYYIHDVALLPEARGRGAAPAAVALLADQARAEGLSHISLVAIAGTQAFWRWQGFTVVERAELNGKLASYDSSARYMSRALALELAAPSA